MRVPRGRGRAEGGRKKRVGPSLGEDDIRKKDYHYEKRLKQGIKQAAKFEARKILRRMKGVEGEGEGDGGEKLKRQLESAKEVDADAMCEALRAEVVSPAANGGGSEEGAATTSGRDEGEVLGKLSYDDVVLQRISRHKCVREAVREWLATRSKLLKQIEQQKIQRQRQAEGAKDREEQRKQRREKKKEKKKSDPKDDGPAKENKKKQPQKKRMGQRARRLLAEKTYGWQAKHLQVKVSEDHPYWKNASKEQREEFEKGNVGGSIPSGGKGLRLTAPGEGGRRRTQEPKPKGGQNKPAATRVTRVRAERENEENLHPSWQAKKLAKKKVGIAEGKGKKIVFD
ncbi:BUD22 domain-containing protein [Chloropicon primus]|uniref:Bud22 domain-containing protein n=1 Tax=Chloropicon primus TaxID=1764295 RepID=A0A5B8MNX0_9CHLO|nr:hypothetical protein A3770_07p47070 [Chloropicon primus]UPR01406.1 BUD22 domain-containing protein [Chloropicon primus]|eukprot:QDZ22189.1 hypothetical protein A3770_07p47070 [Chloropicon primus]